MRSNITENLFSEFSELKRIDSCYIKLIEIWSSLYDS